MSTKLGRFGKIRDTNHTKPQHYGHKGGNTMAGWWVMDAAFPFAGIAAQEDHQFHENWKWGFWPFWLGLIGVAVAIAAHIPLTALLGSVGAHLVAIAAVVLMFWGIGNFTFLLRHGRTEMVGQVVETMIGIAYYNVDPIVYRQRQSDQMEYYRDKKGKGFFTGWSDERIAAEMLKHEAEALRWIDKHGDEIDRYFAADKFRGATS